MPRYVIKPDPGQDLYVMWSTIVDNGWVLGSREQALQDPEVTAERLARADEHGTSAHWPGPEFVRSWEAEHHEPWTWPVYAFGWGDEQFTVGNEPAVGNRLADVNRSDLVAYLLAEDPARAQYLRVRERPTAAEGENG